MSAERKPFLWHVRQSVRRPDECWPWSGYIMPNGYPMIGSRPAYRAVWELLVGPIGEGFELDHLCKNPRCVNPHHLEAVLPIVNNMRSASPASLAAKKTHCSSGHPFDAANTYFRKDGHGQRVCRTCRRLGMRKKHAPTAPPV